jgi:hypothetical protein
MATLNDDVKRFIVKRLACFDTPSEVANAVKAQFGIEMPRMHVAEYDPCKKAGAKLSEKWRRIFDATRQEFIREVGTIPVAHRSVRLRTLERMAQKAEYQKNFALAAQLLEQAAKETGDLYVSRRSGIPRQTGSVGTPISLDDMFGNQAFAKRPHEGG